jgi:hypothetical protein
MSFVHASPAKGGNNTVDVVPGECPCPVEVDSGECDPGPGGGECEVAEDCNEDEFCYESHCLAIVD